MTPGGRGTLIVPGKYFFYVLIIAMRQEIQVILQLGQMPSASTANLELVKQWQSAIEALNTSITDDEAAVLCRALPQSDDDCFGLEWTIVHFIESAPGWSIKLLGASGLKGPWAARLSQRLRNAKNA